MNRQGLLDLAWLTITTPRDAALEIMSMRLDRMSLWSVLILAAIFNTLLFIVLQNIGGRNPDLPSFTDNPFTLFLLIAGILVVTVYALYWTGKIIGGTGDFHDMLSLMAWLQILRVAAQAVTLLLFLSAPVIAALFSLVAGIWAFWITGCFVAAALHLSTPFHGLMVLILAAIAIAVGAVFLGGIIGLSIIGVPAHV